MDANRSYFSQQSLDLFESPSNNSSAGMVPIRDPQIHYTQLFINNEWVNSSFEKSFPIFNPTTGQILCYVQESDKIDVNSAVWSCREAFSSGSRWRSMSASSRGLLMHKLANLMERDMDYIASLETLNSGKVFKTALWETRGAISCFRYYAGMADKIHGLTIPGDGNCLYYTQKEPIGVCGLILPWSFPLGLLSQKLSAALASGCTAVVKPAEQTPLTTLHLASLALEVGFPPGVINVLPGKEEVGALLAEHMDVQMISFTGSSKVGKLIEEAAGRSNCKRLTLEMGGKCPLVVFADCDLDKAVRIAHRACFFHQGQVCCSASRTFVQEDIYDRFVEKSREMALQRVLGDPFLEDTIQGPQINETRFGKIRELIESGIDEGATLMCGGEPWGEEGYFLKPAVFAHAQDHMRIAREEILGPVQVLLKFKTLDEVVARANDSDYGLTAGVITDNIKTALVFAQKVKAGSVWVNTWFAMPPQIPFGGSKMSGIGKELYVFRVRFQLKRRNQSTKIMEYAGEDGILSFLEIKSVAIRLPK